MAIEFTGGAGDRTARFSALSSDGICHGAVGRFIKSDIPTLGSSGNPTADQLTAMALNVALILGSAPDLISAAEPAAQSSKPRSRHKRSHKTPAIYPRWIGKGLVRSERKAAPKGGSHSSPATQWRSGHWRQQPVGQGRVDRRAVWIRPILINAR